MIYLDNGATSFPKPKAVTDAVVKAMETCAPEQVAFTPNCSIIEEGKCRQYQ